MSFPIYTYEAHFKWKWGTSQELWAIPTKPHVEDGITADMETVFKSSFAESMAQAGHWFKFDKVTTNFTKYDAGVGIGLPPVENINVEGETIIYFESDVKDALAHNSPQLWQVVQQVITNFMQYLAAHPELVAVVIGIGILTILAIQLLNTTAGSAQAVSNALQGIGSNVGAAIIVIGGLVVVGLTVYALFFTKQGKKASSKAYQTARRGYSGVRRRLQ